jgi:TonB-dependent SusC/RagA subfamily outer membrane receptor
MTDMEAYLLKASAILALFLLAYQALLRRETFFRVNRFFLLSGIFAALLLPLVTLREEVAIPLELMAGQTASAVPAMAGPEAGDGLRTLLLAAYLLGALFFLGRTGRQLLGVLKLMKGPDKIRKEGVVLRPTAQVGTPFSFLKQVFYNPKAHDAAELQQILEHEKVHARQWHTLDILLARAAAVLLWLNPLAWVYQKTIQENLEYLADAGALRQLPSPREYQYTLLKVSGNPVSPSLVNAFNNPILKKRIVMLHQTPSKTIHLLKYLLIVPALALFLMAFNRETVYVPQLNSARELITPGAKTIEVTIDKNTPDEALVKMKEDLAKADVDFSYTTVRNEAGEIIQISIHLIGTAKNGNSFSGSFTTETEGPIEPILVRITEGSVFIGGVSPLEEGDLRTGEKDTESTVWIFRSDDSPEEVIEMEENGGKRVIRINGEPVDTEDLRKQGKAKKILVNMLEVRDTLEPGVTEVRIENIVVEEDGVEERIIEMSPGRDSVRYRAIVIDSEKSGDFPQGNQSKMSFYPADISPLIFIDGKKAGKKQMKGLDPDQIESINVLKGEAALEKHGKKAANGVIEITTKKQ